VVQTAEEAQVVEAAESGDSAAALPANGAPALNPAPMGPGEVVLTASNNVWLRIYDASDKVLFEKEMAAGERYVVPADANDPKIRTGRADLIAITVNGKAVPTLGPAERTVKDVGISAAALLARPAAMTDASADATSAVPAIPRAIPPARP
jgi:cytoskeleton protein RodZ